MARQRGISISIKLITITTLLVSVAIGIFGVMNNMRSRRLIDESSDRLQDSMKQSLRRAGQAQLDLLAQTSRSAVYQSDWTTLREIIRNIKTRDELVTEVSVISPLNKYFAHWDQARDDKDVAPDLLKLIRQEKGETGFERGKGKTATLAFVKVVKHEGEVQFTAFLEYSLQALHKELARAQQLKKQEVRKSLRSTLVIGSLSLLLGVVLAIFQGLRISRPIQALAAQANQIAAGDLEARVNIKTNDEIGFLGDRFNFMAEQVVVLMHETSEKATMEKELEVASAVQSTLVPSSDSIIEVGGMQLSGYFVPATQCGGDWWSYYELSDGRVLVIIGDVTGHGVASAMVTAAAKGAATSIIAASDYNIDLVYLLNAMNAAIHDAAKGRFVMTCFASIYDPKTRKMVYANAGHTFPYLVDAQGKLLSLVARGNRLGDVLNSEFNVKETEISAGSLLVWYTDGIVECTDARGEEYGERRFRSSIKKHAALPPDQARDNITDKANAFFGEVPKADDITLVFARFL